MEQTSRKATEITEANWQDYVGKEVYAYWGCRDGGVIYPDHNRLLGVVDGFFRLQPVDEPDFDDWEEWWLPILPANHSTDSTALFDWNDYKGITNQQSNEHN